MRRLFADFFLNMSIGRGRRCAQIVLDSAVGLRAGADVEGFTTGMADLVERNFGVPAKEFSLIAFATEMFELLFVVGGYLCLAGVLNSIGLQGGLPTVPQDDGGAGAVDGDGAVAP